ncbi:MULTISPECIES: DUF188 domain-containing protein [unclassified Fusibacter]|uniref:YaiI/YqxD family protein n=1 Tax=unclassified Fusibacter TaxID=2624464 RepID=UPI0010112296|nr:MULTISPECIES: DUF188 domain-containing protein [unclassified Fusibacter]MCK8058609.1 DUF188 domain-containing protein [Fusibacter sp. A2]NPE22621.1 YaiI/YqxD family protein [Fusibacter sp. A1]RXV60185.1 YaiI/YqxD family protein [Fusibacter sp. A1]
MTENTNQNARTIWIDADGCPVVKESVRIAKKHHWNAVVVKNHAVQITSDYAAVITVDTTRDAADFYIANHMKQGDVVVTGDYGLAAMALAKSGKVITNNGRYITNETIDFVLETRHENKMNRMQGKRGTKIKKRTAGDNERFTEALIELVSKMV